MKKLPLIIFLFIIISFSSKALQVKTDSLLKKNSVGIVFTGVPNFISETYHTRLFFPQFELVYQHQFSKKTYLSAGIIYPYNSNNRFTPSIIKYRAANIQFRAGLDFKLKLFRRFYFSPTFDFYFSNERYPNFYHPSEPGFVKLFFPLALI